MRFCFLEIAVKGTAYPKTMGNFKKQNFDLPTRRVGMLRVTNGHSGSIPRGQPNGLGCSEVTKSAHCF